MSTTSYSPPLPVGPATTINRHLKGEWTKLRTLPSTWRTSALAATLAIGLTAAVDVQQSGLTAQQRLTSTRRALRCWSHHRRHPARSARRAVGHRGVRHRHDPLHLQRDAGQATGDSGQGRDRGRVRPPGRAAVRVAGFTLGQQILASMHLQVALSHPGVPRAIVFGAVAASLVAIIGVGLGGLIRHTAAATTALTLIIVGDVILGQLLPAGLREYLPGTAVQAAITVHRSGAAHPRRGDCGPRRVRRHRPRRSTDSGGAPRRLTNLTNGLEHLHHAS